MSDTWYYAVHGDRTGPLTFQQLREALAKLPNAGDVLVWRDGFPDWKRVGEVPELRSPGAAAPPLPPRGAPQGPQPPQQQGTRAASFGDLGGLWFGLEGRANRGKYWLVVLVNIVILVVVAGLLIFTLPPMGVSIVLALVYAALLSPISIKRLHDRNKPNWWVLIFVVIPISAVLLETLVGETGGLGIVLSLVQLVLGIWGFVELGCLRGTVGPNDYGEDPLAGRT